MASSSVHTQETVLLVLLVLLLFAMSRGSGIMGTEAERTAVVAR
jgi:hypothetical protein